MAQWCFCPFMLFFFFTIHCACSSVSYWQRVPVCHSLTLVWWTFTTLISLLISQTVVFKPSTKGHHWPRGLDRPLCICLGHYYQAFKIGPVCAVCVVLFITAVCAVHYHHWRFAVWQLLLAVKKINRCWPDDKKKYFSGLLNASCFMNDWLCSSHKS